MSDIYVVINDFNEEVKSCVGIYHNYCEALGKAYYIACDIVSDPNLNNGDYNISIPRWDSLGDDYVYITISMNGEYHYIYIYYYGDKKPNQWEVN